MWPLVTVLDTQGLLEPLPQVCQHLGQLKHNTLSQSLSLDAQGCLSLGSCPLVADQAGDLMPRDPGPAFLAYTCW